MSFLDKQINDVTTAPDAAPDFGNGIPGYPRAEFAPKQKRAYPEVQPLALDAPPDAVFAKVKELAGTMERWTIEVADEAAHRLRAIARTKIIGFKDDVVVVVEKRGAGSVVQMRSRSRLGKADFGANARRINDFLGRLQTAARRATL